MTDTSRRKFLAATGAGVAGSVAVGSAAHAAAPRADRAQEAVVAYVPDHTSDEVHLMLGEREVVAHDRDLVTRILNAAGGR